MKRYWILKQITGAPEEFRLLPLGRVELADGITLTLDQAGMDAIMKRFEARGNDMVIDYEHQTMEQVQAPAAGWITALEARPDGLWARVRWTEKAKAYLEAGEYRYFSPVLLSEKTTGRIVQIENVALTNYPRLNNLNPLVAKATEGQPIEEDGPMLKRLKKILKLDENATEDQVAEAAGKMAAESEQLALKAATAERLTAHKDILAALDALESDPVSVVVAKAKALKAPADAAAGLASQVETLKGEIASMKASGLLELALKDGKTSPAEVEAWGRELAASNPEQFRKIVLSRAVGSVVPVGSLPGKKEDATKGQDAESMHIMKMLGVDKEDLEKYGKDRE